MRVKDTSGTARGASANAAIVLRSMILIMPPPPVSHAQRRRPIVAPERYEHRFGVRDRFLQPLAKGISIGISSSSLPLLSGRIIGFPRHGCRDPLSCGSAPRTLSDARYDTLVIVRDVTS